MAFASSETIRDTFKGCIQPYRKSRVQHAAYELSLGAEVVTTSDGALRVLDPPSEGEDEGGHINIEPGQLAMLITEEVIAMPEGYLGFISIKASIKLSGLVNISGFHVDPGFVGRLKFSVYNAGSDPVPLRRGQATFLLWFAELDQVTRDVYDGKHKRQRHISSRDIENIQGNLASPASLDQRVRKLATKLEADIEKLRGSLSNTLREGDAELNAKLASLDTEVSRLRTLLYGAGGSLVVSLVVGVVILALSFAIRGCSEDSGQSPSTVYLPAPAPTTMESPPTVEAEQPVGEAGSQSSVGSDAAEQGGLPR